MGLLDPTLFGNLNKLKGLLGETPIGKYLRGQDQGVSVNGLKQALLGMPVFDQRAGEQDMAYAADAIGPQVMGLVGKIVYHGSPHKFDKFDASKIGTGEGAQAYGHGTYLADREDVARAYKETLSGTDQMTSAGRAARYMEEANGDRLRARQLAYSDYNNHGDSPHIRNTIWGAIEKINEKGTHSPSLYKADLPDELIPKMLDWDKPLNEAPAQFKSLLSSSARYADPHVASRATIGEAIGELAGIYGGRAQASAKLREAGFPGIRYLDGGSRSAGKGSYNYVVFPGLEDKVKILERNGIPINDGLLGRK